MTGKAAGHDVDGGRTTIRSPLITLPPGGRARIRLRYWVGLSRSAGAADGLRVHIVDADGKRLGALLKVSGNGHRRAPAWKTLLAPMPPGLAGHKVAIELVAVDTGADATVEAAVDEVRVIAG